MVKEIWAKIRQNCIILLGDLVSVKQEERIKWLNRGINACWALGLITTCGVGCLISAQVWEISEKVVNFATWATAIGGGGLCAVGTITWHYNRSCEARIAKLRAKP